jgi:hypothetical protein
VKQWALDLNLPNIKAMKADSTTLLPVDPLDNDGEPAAEEQTQTQTPKPVGQKQAEVIERYKLHGAI